MLKQFARVTARDCTYLIKITRLTDVTDVSTHATNRHKRWRKAKNGEEKRRQKKIEKRKREEDARSTSGNFHSRTRQRRGSEKLKRRLRKSCLKSRAVAFNAIGAHLKIPSKMYSEISACSCLSPSSLSRISTARSFFPRPMPPLT